MKAAFMFFILLVFLGCEPKRTDTAQTTSYPNTYLEEITITQLQKAYQDGTHSITGVVKDYLARIEAIDKNGPQINSIIFINPDALAIAEALEKEWKEGKIRGPLHGIPIILKDNIDTHDNMPNTAGATVLRNSFPAQDSWVAKKLKDAGAIIIAKANLSEWANFRGDMSSSGWSGIGGQTKNPYVLDRNPCGSSAGSGAAVAANLCAFAIGTETNGSIVCPSNNNGIVGIKPTVGLISRTGIIPISFTQDTPGPMGRTVEDVAIALGVLTGIDSSDSKTLEPKAIFHQDYTQFLKKDGLKGKRIGLIKDVSGYHAGVDTLMKRTVAFLRSQGAEVIEIEESVSKGANSPSFQVLLYEFKDGLNNYLAGLSNSPVKDLQGLIEFNKKDSVELRYFDQKILEMAQTKGDLKTKEYLESLAAMHKATREEGIDKVMDKYKLDALMAPTGSPAWKTDLVDGDHFLGGSSSAAAIAGYPSITVPMGFINELPVNVSFFGKAWTEPILLEIAFSYEQGTKHRRPPHYIPTN